MRHGDLIQRMPPRVRIALLISLFVHACLLRLFLGGQTFGLPGLDVFWKPRDDAGDLRIELAPLQPIVPIAPSAPDTVADSLPPPVHASALPVTPPALRAVPPAPAALPAPPAPVVAAAAPVPVITARAPSPVTLPVAPEPAPAIPDPAIAQQQADDARAAAERAAQAQRDAESLAQQRAAQLARDALAQQALARAEAARQASAQRLAQEAQARQAADQADAARREQVRQDADRIEAARREQARRAQQEAARQEAIRQEAAQRDAARQAQLQQDQLTQTQLKQDQLKPDQPGQAQQERLDQEAKREARLQAIGAQMKQEAAQRDAPARSLLPSASSLRRGLLLGRADANTELVNYAEALARKIELNQTMDLVRDVARLAHAPPLVTVAIRADGSVEKVTFVVSSGVPALDEAIRSVIASQAPYGPFTPALARQYDVVEIRRTWLFDNAIRLQ